MTLKNSVPVIYVSRPKSFKILDDSQVKSITFSMFEFSNLFQILYIYNIKLKLDLIFPQKNIGEFGIQ